jgi:hypothetical protein
MKASMIILILYSLSDVFCFAKQFKNNDNYPFSVNPDYTAPSARVSFYNKYGLVNTTKSLRDRRLNPQKEWEVMKTAIAQRPVRRAKIVNSDFASVVGIDYYQKNGLVSVGRKQLKRRQGLEQQLPLIYGRDLYQERTRKLASVKQSLTIPINKIEVEIPLLQKRDTQEVVSPR